MASQREQSGLYLQRVMRGGVIVDKPSLAERLAEVFIADLYGQKEIERQKPLKVLDNGGTWTVLGTYSNHGSQGTGAVRIVIGKEDGRLLDADLPYIAHIKK